MFTNNISLVSAVWIANLANRNEIFLTIVSNRNEMLNSKIVLNFNKIYTNIKLATLRSFSSHNPHELLTLYCHRSLMRWKEMKIIFDEIFNWTFRYINLMRNYLCVVNRDVTLLKLLSKVVDFLILHDNAILCKFHLLLSFFHDWRIKMITAESKKNRQRKTIK